MQYLNKISWGILVIACLTLGLAPFAPPHIWEKLVMLKNGELSRPLDWFDLFYHGIPWLLLIMKAAASLKKQTFLISRLDHEQVLFETACSCYSCFA